MWGDGWGCSVVSGCGRGNNDGSVHMGSWAPSTPALDAGLMADPPYWPYVDALRTGSFVGRHNGLCDFNFCDGHAKAVTLPAMRANVYNWPIPPWGTTPIFANLHPSR